jgi:DNA-directed RNA polymerase subunit E'/Rpb7
MLITSLITKNIILLPDCLKANIKECIFNEIVKKYEKTCINEHGLLISVKEIINIDNYINKDSINITFIVTFKGETIKPENDMIVSFIPNKIMNIGIFGKIYDKINFFIPIENLEEYEYIYNDSDDLFENKNGLKITKDNKINVKIKQIKSTNGLKVMSSQKRNI